METLIMKLHSNMFPIITVIILQLQAVVYYHVNLNIIGLTGEPIAMVENTPNRYSQSTVLFLCPITLGHI